jgi:NTP pyrophosphatase (non-canonical NTP hydrolase)
MQNYLQAIEHEVNRAKELFSWDNVDLNLAVVILTEEVGEAAKAAIDYQFKGKPIQDLRDELIQTAAMAIRTLELIEGYSDTKVTDFKVGDRVKWEHHKAEIIRIMSDTNEALIEYFVEVSVMGFPEYNEHRYIIPLTDLTLISE